MVRLFIYHTEAQNKEEIEKTTLSNQFIIMGKEIMVGNNDTRYDFNGYFWLLDDCLRYRLLFDSKLDAY